MNLLNGRIILFCIVPSLMLKGQLCKFITIISRGFKDSHLHYRRLLSRIVLYIIYYRYLYITSLGQTPCYGWGGVGGREPETLLFMI